MTDPLHPTISLGKTGLQISPMGIGAWAWGDRFFWGYGRGYQDSDIRAAFETSVEQGINFYDTAEMYGQGRSERILGDLLSNTQMPVIVATKFAPVPWRLTASALLRALKNSLKRLGLQQVDLYQIHWPYFSFISIESLANALADAVEQKLARSVGVSNYNEDQMRRAHAVLAKRGIPLASNQVEYSLANRKIEFNGLLKACQELDISLISYSPLAQGALTGKYTPDKPLPGIRARRYNRAYLEKIQPLIRQMREIGRAHDGKTPAQVALNWLICKGTIPIPGAKNTRQALDNSGALGWQLTHVEMQILDELSQPLS